MRILGYTIDDPVKYGVWSGCIVARPNNVTVYIDTDTFGKVSIEELKEQIDNVMEEALVRCLRCLSVLEENLQNKLNGENGHRFNHESIIKELTDITNSIEKIMSKHVITGLSVDTIKGKLVTVSNVMVNGLSQNDYFDIFNYLRRATDFYLTLKFGESR